MSIKQQERRKYFLWQIFYDFSLKTRKMDLVLYTETFICFQGGFFIHRKKNHKFSLPTYKSVFKIHTDCFILIFRLWCSRFWWLFLHKDYKLQDTKSVKSSAWKIPNPVAQPQCMARRNLLKVSIKVIIRTAQNVNVEKCHWQWMPNLQHVK